MSKSHSPLLLFIFVSTIVFQSSNVQSWLFKSAGQNAAKALGGSVTAASANLANSLNNASDKLSQSINKGVEATAATVRELAGSMEEMAKSVSVRINSGDLEHIGADATKNIKEALDQLSKNWNMAISTADLKDVGAEAARYLSEAIQNVNIKLEVFLAVDDNVVRAVLYISIAVGIGFSVCCVAIVISLRQCRSCTMSLFVTCAEGCRSCRNSNNRNPEKQKPDDNEGEELKVFIGKNNKNNKTANKQNNLNENDFKRMSITLEEYNDFNKVNKFWQNQTG